MDAAKDFCVAHDIPLVIKIHPDLKGIAVAGFRGKAKSQFQYEAGRGGNSWGFPRSPTPISGWCSVLRNSQEIKTPDEIFLPYPRPPNRPEVTAVKRLLDL